MRVRFQLLPIVCLGLQAAIMAVPMVAGFADPGRRALLLLSYVGLAFFVWLNRRLAGILVIGAGLALNFAAIAANGGLMPISPQALERAGLTEKSVNVGSPLPHSKNVLLTRGETKLWPLTDTLTLSNPLGIHAFSPGDVIIVGGLLVTAGQGLLGLTRGRAQVGRRSTPIAMATVTGEGPPAGAQGSALVNQG